MSAEFGFMDEWRTDFLPVAKGGEDRCHDLRQPLPTVDGSNRFAGSYKIDGLTKTAAVKMIGNSVCPDMSYAIVKANFKRRVRKAVAA